MELPSHRTNYALKTTYVLFYVISYVTCNHSNVNIVSVYSNVAYFKHIHAYIHICNMYANLFDRQYDMQLYHIYISIIATHNFNFPCQLKATHKKRTGN